MSYKELPGLNGAGSACFCCSCHTRGLYTRYWLDRASVDVKPVQSCSHAASSILTSMFCSPQLVKCLVASVLLFR